VGTALVDLVQPDDMSAVDVREPVLGPGVAVAGSPPSPHARDSRARVIAAALRCVARFGVSKTTVDDIAREAGLSRATLYRTFPGGRDEVLVAVVESEISSFFSELDAQLDAAASIEELLVVALVSSAEQLVRHEALRFLLAYEPEVVVPFIAFQGFDSVLLAASRHLGPYLQPHLGETQARRVAEWMARLVVSHVVSPPGAAGDLGLGSTRPTLQPAAIGEERARRLVRQFVMPGIHVLTTAQRPELIDQQPTQGRRRHVT
jgi:AcrR family transcriptional regulator